MMDQILLVKATDADAQEVLEITKRAFDLYAKEIRKRESVAALYETLDDVLSDIHHKNVYLARIDGEIVGSVRFELLTDGIPRRRTLASAACSWKRCVSNVFPWGCARSRCIPHPRCVPQWLFI